MHIPSGKHYITASNNPAEVVWCGSPWAPTPLRIDMMGRAPYFIEFKPAGDSDLYHITYDGHPVGAGEESPTVSLPSSSDAFWIINPVQEGIFSICDREDRYWTRQGVDREIVLKRLNGPPGEEQTWKFHRDYQS